MRLRSDIELENLALLGQLAILNRHLRRPKLRRRKVERPEESKGRLRYLSKEGEGRLLAEAKEPLRTIVLVGIYSGLKTLAEALTLRWENVDPVRGFVTVGAAFAEGRQTDTLQTDRMVIHALTRPKADAGSEWAFLSRSGEPFKSMRSAFTNACKRAKFTDVTPHTHRHASAGRPGMRGAGDRTQQALGRRQEPRMVRRHVHLSEEHLREAIETLAEKVPAIFTTPAGEAPNGAAVRYPQV